MKELYYSVISIILMYVFITYLQGGALCITQDIYVGEKMQMCLELISEGDS